MIGPALKYPGAKWRIADWILAHVPPHEVYVEPFFGSGAVFFRKSPTKVEILNDVDGRVVNLFRVIRERPHDLAAAVGATPWSRQEYDASYGPAVGGDAVEDARRFLVRCWQAVGTKTGQKSGWRANRSSAVNKTYPRQWQGLPARIVAAASRLKDAHVECLPALDLLALHGHVGTLIYADPPYPLSTRADSLYAHEMSDSDHLEVLDALDAHPGPVLLSGYGCELYDARLDHWERKTAASFAEGGRPREEVLWINPVAAEALEGRLF